MAIQMEPYSLDFSRFTVQLQDAELKRIGRDPYLGLTQELLVHPTFLVLLEGSCQLRRGSRVCDMKTDTLYICKPGGTISLNSDRESASVAVLRVGMYRPSADSKGHLEPINGQGAFPFPEEARLPQPVKPTERCRAICSLCSCEDPILRCRAQIETMEFLLEVAEGHSGQMEPALDPIEGVKNYMEEHLDEPLTTDRLAAMAGLTAKRFTSLFRKRYGASPHDYLTRTRLHHAVRIMLRPCQKLKDVAHAVGYEDEFYFSRLFKRVYGLSPSQYVIERKHRTAVYGSSAGTGYLLALDVIPQAAPLHPKWSGYYLENYGTDIPYPLEDRRMESTVDSNLHRLRDAEPRLIVCPSDLTGQEKEQLESLAPTFLLPPEENESWRIGLRRLAELLGVEAKAKRWIREFEERTAHAKARIKAASGGKAPAALFIRMTAEGMFGLGSPGTLDYVYRHLGIKRPDMAPRDGDEEERVTLQQLAFAEKEHLMILVRQDTRTLMEWKKLLRTPEWQSLPAVRSNRVHLLSSSPWREYSPIALDRMRENLIHLFDAHSAGSGASVRQLGG
ncbi:AraC family transcriptional regulator [Gorillibacterium sp. CAU 1737]|uniref:AraC family transcriptional regulator n=1 Tax=Gorillibacterium sp. CAU 1737 TaxID=3140362 RepID=UPI00326144BF